jgi:hypothetical protein
LTLLTLDINIMKRFGLAFFWCFINVIFSFSQELTYIKKNVNDRHIQGLFAEIGFGNSKSYFQATRLGLNFRAKNNWHINLDYDGYVNDVLYPLQINSYLLGDISLRLGKQYRRGIWLYGATIGPSYFFKNRVTNVRNFIIADFAFSSTIGLSPKVSLIATPTKWLGFGVSYNYNLNSIESTNLLWFSVYLGRMRFKLKDYQRLN